MTSGRVKSGRTIDRRESHRAASRLPGSSTPAEFVALARDPFIARLRSGLFDHCGVPRGARVVLAVSGGADSLALLLGAAVIATRSRRSGGITPICVHVNHHLRPSADADARYVERQCARLGVLCDVVDIDPARTRGNLEAVARRLRYAALLDATRRHRASCVATAHHADDQLETILMGLCRDGRVDATLGMPWVRPLEESTPSHEGGDQQGDQQGRGAKQPGRESPVLLIRPFLGHRHVECELFCRRAGRRWRHDESNDDLTRARARLRRDVVPVLESLWPGTTQRVARALAQLPSAPPSKGGAQPSREAIAPAGGHIDLDPVDAAVRGKGIPGT